MQKTTIAKATPQTEQRNPPEPFTIRRQIGTIVYEVEVHFNPDAKETMHDKMLRLLRHDMERAS